MATIMDTLSSTDMFSMLTLGLKTTQLDDIIQKGKSYTIFAPTDVAFSKIPKGALNELLQDKDKLKQILMYHLVEGNHSSEELAEQIRIDSMLGKPISINFASGMDVNTASYTKTDIKTDNGIIHAINSVLLPRVDNEV